ncbi:DUF4190 domain-containing protein [Frigoribacterium sp. ACAM 257]|uniref:DUF4190 domain-containing protein n=1 Tax=Frigoribacterium sp. ACAM 257 TaxID=2508998 RepID=UPI0011B9ABBB|nr:DUF4190 domain-containing protein [Frigoribacterium sp. ACAM 257]TWX35640.1 DUF4190 domain-containing protein [Frigoribacterium sp. ACAM 257]
MTDDRTPPEDPADEADQPNAAQQDAAHPAADQQHAEGQAADQQVTHDLGAPAPDAVAPPAPAGASGWAIAALVVGIGAFLVGLVPVVGLLVALVGVALGIVALVRRRRAQSGLGLGVTGVALSGVAAVTNVVVVAALVVAVPLGARLADEAANSWYGGDQGQVQGDDPDDSGLGEGDAGLDGIADRATTSTSCWSFSLPDDTWLSEDHSDAVSCSTSVLVADGTDLTWVDAAAVPAAVSAGLVPSTSTDRVADAVAALRQSWLPRLGTVVGEPEQTTLDGEPAALVRLATGPDLGTPVAVVVAWSPEDAAGTSSLTLVTLGDSESEFDHVDADDRTRAAATERTLTSLTGSWDWAGR